jgi:hypothetical protein
MGAGAAEAAATLESRKATVQRSRENLLNMITP